MYKFFIIWDFLLIFLSPILIFIKFIKLNFFLKRFLNNKKDKVIKKENSLILLLIKKVFILLIGNILKQK